MKRSDHNAFRSSTSRSAPTIHPRRPPLLKVNAESARSSAYDSSSVAATQTSGSIQSIPRPVPPLSSVRVPHCGYHYDGAPRRFFEGWYWKVIVNVC